MDDPDHGVLVTVIDLGLARMDSHDATSAGVHWTPFDEETFEGEGDYQFDVYRMMRTHNGDCWREYRPLTNVMVSVFHSLQYRRRGLMSCCQFVSYSGYTTSRSSCCSPNASAHPRWPGRVQPLNLHRGSVSASATSA